MNRFICLAALSLSVASLEASYTLKEGKFIHSEDLSTMSVQEHHSAALEALHTKNWQELVRQATIITKNFPSTPFSNESYFFLGKGYLELKEYEQADHNLALYLKKQGMPKHFEDAMEGKLIIAEQFRLGAKKHLLGLNALPKWVPARDEALKIYDEVSTAMPNHELAARALLGKSLLLFDEDDFKPAVENLQILIRRFPKHELAAQAFVEIGRFYLKEVQEEFPDPDLLDLAEINLRKFTTEFPSDVRVEQAKEYLKEMQEFFAGNLFDTGQFFERTKKPHAALIYYARIVRDFPATHVAKRAQERRGILSPDAKAPSLPAENTESITATEEPPSRVDHGEEVSIPEMNQTAESDEPSSIPSQSEESQEVVLGSLPVSNETTESAQN